MELLRVITMGFVPRYIKKTSIFIGALCVCFFTSNSYANTKVLVWGDSLSAAYGIPVEKGWVKLLGQALGKNHQIINGSISGETTQGGLSRLPAALKAHEPDFIILELGANDGLRGIPPNVTKNNLQQMIDQAKQSQTEVILFGMKIPPNYGFAYSKKFEALFSELANEHQLPFIPFFLESVIENLALFQADELHPTAEAQPLILDFILPILRKELKSTNLKPSESALQHNKIIKEIKNPA